MFNCCNCHKSFDTNRGLSIHLSKSICHKNTRQSPHSIIQPSAETSPLSITTPIFKPHKNKIDSSVPTETHADINNEQPSRPFPTEFPPLPESPTCTPIKISSATNISIFTPAKTSLTTEQPIEPTPTLTPSESFLETQFQGIKDHLTSLFTSPSYQNTYNIPSHNQSCTFHSSTITDLQKQISKLSDELANKQKIIDTLLQDRNELIRNMPTTIKKTQPSPPSPTPPWQKPKNPIIPQHRHTLQIPTANRFSGFQCTTHLENKTNQPSQTKTSPLRKPPTRDKTKPIRKVVVISDSMTRHIKPHLLHPWTPNHTTQFSYFPGATTKSLHHYIEPTLKQQPHDDVIIHVGTNDISPRENQPHLTDNEIANQTISIGNMCRNFDTKNIYISGIIPRLDPKVDQRRMVVNNLLKKMCQQNKFIYIDNSNIPRHKVLYHDRVHLSDQGIPLFANNIIKSLNRTPI